MIRRFVQNRTIQEVPVDLGEEEGPLKTRGRGRRLKKKKGQTALYPDKG